MLGSPHGSVPGFLLLKLPPNMPPTAHWALNITQDSYDVPKAKPVVQAHGEHLLECLRHFKLLLET